MKKKSKKKLVSIIIALILIALLIGVFMMASYQYATIKIDRVSEKFTENGYKRTTSALLLGPYELALSVSGVEKIVEIFLATKDDESIIILYFANSDDAEAAFTALKDDDNKNLGMRGKTVYYGTDIAVDLYKKILF